jgi:hydrogenase maturation protease
METAMVIGYGNELRGDDGIGQRIAEIVDSWHLLTVKSLAFHQLTPELAATIAEVKLVIFVDASIHENLQVESLSLTGYNNSMGHFTDPKSLLALAQFLYGYAPPAWLIAVPGENFELSDRLSPTAEKGMKIALAKIIEILDQNHNLKIKSTSK